MSGKNTKKSVPKDTFSLNRVQISMTLTYDSFSYDYLSYMLTPVLCRYPK